MRATRIDLELERLPAARRSLRVAVVTESYPPEVNGVATTIARFVEGLRQRNHSVQIVRPRQEADRGAADAPDRGRDFLVRGLPIPRYPDLKMGLPAKKALARLWTYERPDVVHLVTEGPLGWSALQAAARLRIPMCSDFRTNFHAYSRHYGIGWLNKPILAYLKKFHNRTRYTMVPTESLRSTLEGLGFRNLRVVARGVDTLRFHPCKRSIDLRRLWGAGEDDPVILHVGRLAAEKNLGVLAEVHSRLRALEPRARLVVVGDGPARRDLELRCRGAIFAGTRTGEDLAAHYASGDIFLFPSLTETYGNVTVEAMASGLAVVAYDHAAAAEHIVHGESGMVAACDDSAAFVRHACELMRSTTRIRRIGASARERAEGLEWGRVVEQFEALLFATAAESAAHVRVASTYPWRLPA
ncbi:MAG: glycosyltransferase family 4 protein [Burkholderiales bacterium]